jgi:prolyl-tRNA synthetase
LAVLGKVERIVREEMAKAGAQEVHLPALVPAEPYQVTGRYDEYGATMFRHNDRRGNPHVLAPTHEEMFTLLVKDMYSSYKDLPITIYQIQTKYRDEARPRAGILRGREFIMKDAYSFDIDDEALAVSYGKQREAYVEVFHRLGLPFVVVDAMSGAMGGSRSEEFLFPTQRGEDTFVRSAGGYAANVEAVTTRVPDPVDASDVPPAHVEQTPGCATIESLVSIANEEFPRKGGAWEASDTLKNVVIRLVHPDGHKELVVIGIPGDREVDFTRLSAVFFPAEVEPASDDDFAAHPELVKGYIGPNFDGAVRYFLDPRIVEGTRWISGANVRDKHVFDLVAGRDFPAAGAQNTVDAAEVRPGDEAPDGSGPLELARGIEIGHIFMLGRKYAEALGLKVLSENGKEVTVTMGSYGMGITRIVGALAENFHDEAGLMWPAVVAPAHVHIVATGKDEAVFAKSEQLARQWSEAGIDVLYDDRPKVSPGVKFNDAELLGMPIIVVVGRDLAQGKVEIRTRASNERALVDVDSVDRYVHDLLAAI